MTHSIRVAFRTLARTPFVTTIAVLSLALGIGANAAIFSLFDQVLLRSLPVPEPDRLVNLAAPGPKPGTGNCGQEGPCETTFSHPMFRDLEARQTVFTGLAAHSALEASVVYQSQPVTGDAILVSGSYFPTLGVHPALGRLFALGDDRRPGTDLIVVVSYPYWQAHLGGDPGVLGKALVVNGQTMTIVGVAPAWFEGTTLGIRPLVYVPISMADLLRPNVQDLGDRLGYWVYLFARLKPGVSIQQATVTLNGLYHAIINDVEVPLQQGMSDATLTQFRSKRIILDPGPQGQSTMHARTRTPLQLLFGVTGIVLLIACSNIANLLLVRGAGRATEMGLRLALGAKRRQLVMQLMLEAVLLAALGGLAGLLVAKWTLAGVARLLPSQGAAGLAFTLQPPILLFAAGLAVVTGVAFGVFPAWHGTRGELVTTIRANARHLTGARAAARVRLGLATLQISLATALLMAAGLFMKSLVNVSRVDLGVHIDSVVTFALSAERAGYDSARAMGFYGQVTEALGGLPGVTAVTAANVPLFGGYNRSRGIYVQGFTGGPDVDRNSRYSGVGSGYFATFGVRPIAGREFTDADRLGEPRVAVVNQTFVKKFNLTTGALGKFMSMSGPDSLNMQIVGIVPDVRYSEVKGPVPPVFYLPWRQTTDLPDMSFYVRTPQPDAVLRAIGGVIRTIDPGVPVEGLKTLPEQVRDNVFLDRMISILSGAFAVLATLLAAVGLYGVLGYSVAQRTREIGIRMALGADAGRVRLEVLRQVGGMMVVGGIIGLAVAIAFGRAARAVLFELNGTDPGIFALSLGVLACVAFAAGYGPARRASRVPPTEALRYE